MLFQQKINDGSKQTWLKRYFSWFSYKYLIGSVLATLTVWDIYYFYLTRETETVVKPSIFAYVILFLVSIVFYYCIKLTAGFIDNYSDRDSYFYTLLKKVKSPIIWIVLFTVVFRNFYSFILSKTVEYYDSISYTDSIYTNPDYNLFTGKVDIFRTPVYPLFIKVIRLFSPYDTLSYNIVYFQIIVSVISVIFFYLALKKVLKNQVVINIFTIAYGCSPTIFAWDKCILTESIAISFFVIFLYIMVSYIKKPSYPLAILTGLYSFFMIMIRPSFIYLIALLAVFFIARLIFSRTDRIKAVAGIVSIVFCFGLVSGYSYLNLIHYKYYGISTVTTTINQLNIIINLDMYENKEYPEVTQYIDNLKEVYKGKDSITYIDEPSRHFGYATVDKFVVSCIKQHWKEYTDYTLNKFSDVSNYDLAVNYVSAADDSYINFDYAVLTLFMPLKIFHVWLLILFSVLFVFYSFIKYKKIHWVLLGLSAIVFTQIFTAIIGAQAEYQRLAQPAIPYVIMMIGCFVDIVVSAIDKRKMRELVFEGRETMFVIEPEDAAKQAFTEGIAEQEENEFKPLKEEQEEPSQRSLDI